jgi:hypothetical protein
MGKAIFTLEISPATLAGLRYLENHVLTMPNRVENIKIRSANSSIKKMKMYLVNKYGAAGRGMSVTSSLSHRGIRLKIAAERANFSNVGASGADKRKMAANMLLYGRKAYTARRSAGDKAYKLREASTPPYPTHLRGFRVKKISPNHSARMDIRTKAQALIMESIEIQARREGFGSRGGNPNRMADTSHVTRSVTPHHGGGR